MKSLNNKNNVYLRKNSLRSDLFVSLALIHHDFKNMIPDVIRFLDKASLWEENEGAKTAFKRLSDLHIAFIAWINNKYINQSLFPDLKFIRNYPKALRLLNRFLPYGQYGQRAIISTLCCYYFIKGKVNEPDYSSFLEANKKTPTDRVMQYACYFKWTKELLRKKFLKLPKGKIKPIYRIVHKQGPSGPASLTAHQSLRKIVDENDELLKNLFILSEDLKYNLKEDIDQVLVSEVIPKDHSKIVIIPQAKFKTRGISIVDPYSQFLLRPYAKYLFEILKKIKQDLTFNQDGIVDFVNKYQVDRVTCTEEEILSGDLSAASNRIPVEPQRGICCAIFGETIGNAIINVMTIRKFKVKDGSYINLVDCQGLGTECSFGLMALWHHITIYGTYCLTFGKPKKRYTFNKYRILGDDLVLGNGSMIKNYNHMLAFNNPVLQNKRKSTWSLIGSNGYIEFASRMFIRKKEITPLSLEIIDKILNHKERKGIIPNLISLVMELGRKSFAWNGLSHLLGHISDLGVAFPKWIATAMTYDQALIYLWKMSLPVKVGDTNIRETKLLREVYHMLMRYNASQSAFNLLQEAYEELKLLIFNTKYCRFVAEFDLPRVGESEDYLNEDELSSRSLLSKTIEEVLQEGSSNIELGYESLLDDTQKSDNTFQFQIIRDEKVFGMIQRIIYTAVQPIIDMKINMAINLFTTLTLSQFQSLISKWKVSSFRAPILFIRQDESGKPVFTSVEFHKPAAGSKDLSWFQVHMELPTFNFEKFCSLKKIQEPFKPGCLTHLESEIKSIPKKGSAPVPIPFFLNLPNGGYESSRIVKTQKDKGSLLEHFLDKVEEPGLKT